MKKGPDGPDPAPAVVLAEQTRVYPLWAMEKDVKPMQFPNGSGKRIDMMYPVDASFWVKLKAFVDYEPVAAIDPDGAPARVGDVEVASRERSVVRSVDAIAARIDDVESSRGVVQGKG